MSETELKRTPLYAEHLALGAKFVDFGGWSMPVEYRGILAEHQAVRERAGLFDVSHMGELEITGPQALALVQRVISGDAARLADGQALYTPICRPDGGTVDDVLVYRLGERFMLVPNAANIAKDDAWVRAHAADLAATVTNASDHWALIALQGPAAQSVLQPLCSLELGGLRRFRAAFAPIDGRSALISRTGYTGEDGFELYCRPDDAVAVWRALLAAGAPHGVVPCGLGARDTLRLEAALPLYGHELSDSINPLEAGLAPFVKLQKDDFVGRAALAAIAERGPERRLIGLVMRERGIPRAHYPVYRGDRRIGLVTSGGPAPALGENIALALVAHDPIEVGDELQIEIRTRRLRAEVTPLPFYRRKPVAPPA
ncbi:MAG TPA: glycine cleavage system aminomethyltransferase GcvT [Limnochordia bacterium]|nr:glycine cleavage system aminomethyltransferase GcvT [Limnochordia bacterium]